MGSDAQKEETPVPFTATNDGRGSSGVNARRYDNSGSPTNAPALDVEALKSTLSPERFAPYVRDGADDLTGLARYSLNIALCQALYPCIHCMEIALRNAIHRELTAVTGSTTWYETLPMLTERQKVDIAAAKDKLRKQGSHTHITPGQVIAELSLGFWTAFFNKRNANNRLSALLVKGVFKHAPKRDRSLKNIDSQLTTFRNLRNRVFHHERIIHWGNLDDTHSRLLEAVRWICPHLAGIAAKHDGYETIRKEGLKPWLTK